MTTQTSAQQVLTGLPTVRLPWGHGTYRAVVSGQTTRDGWPITIGTDSPDDRVAHAAVGGTLPWHLLCQHIRVPVLTGCPAGVTAEALGDGRWLITGPAGSRMIIERISRSR